MQVILDLYSSVHSDEEPLINMDEASVQLQGHLYEPLEMEPNQDKKEDYHYTREGVQALFMFFDPNRGWRRVSNRDHRTRFDWALICPSTVGCRLFSGTKSEVHLVIISTPTT
jgi:hypothetical protein